MLRQLIWMLIGVFLSFLLAVGASQAAPLDNTNLIGSANAENGTPKSSAGTKTVWDAWVYGADSSTSATNYGASSNLSGSPVSTCNTAMSIAYIKFDLHSFPDTVDKVNLVVNHLPHTEACHSNCNADFYFYPVLEPWDEMTITYDNKPALGTEPVSGPVHISFPNDLGQQKYDITDIYRQWKSGAIPNYGLAVYSPTVGCNNAAVGFYVASNENQEFPGPALEITGARQDLCSTANLQKCLNETACTGVGGYWYGNTCNSSPENTPAEVTLQVNESNIDVFFPAPSFPDKHYCLRRCWQPFGEDSPVDMENAVVEAGNGAVRVTHIIIDGQDYWVDLTIDPYLDGVPVDVSDMGLGEPPAELPHWQADIPSVDFTLTTADFMGPPARLRLFDVGINDRLYDVDFVLGSDHLFVISGSRAKGFVHYLPGKQAENKLVVTGQTAAPPEFDENSALDVPGTPWQSAMAIVKNGFDEDGEQSIWINYASGRQMQKMVARNGVLLGTYSPPTATDSILYARAKAGEFQSGILDSISSYFHKPTREEILDACIDKKTALLVGFKSDNKLSQQLVDMVFTIAGSNALKLSSSTLEKIRTTVADSKDVVLEMMANGKVTEATLGTFVASTILKNATPAEQQKIIDAVWGNNIPNHVQTAANVAGSAAGKSFVLASKALAEGIASAAVPEFTAAAKVIIEASKYAKDTLANDAFQELYRVYKESGKWDQVAPLAATSVNKFADSKVREILKAQKRARGDNHAVTDNEIDEYLKNKMETLHHQEPMMEKERERLNRAKEKFLALSLDDKNFLRLRTGADKPDACALFETYLDIISRIQMNLSNAMLSCQSLLSKRDIENRAYFLARYILRGDAAAFQKEKLSWLKNNECVTVENPATGGGGGGQGGSGHGWVRQSATLIDGCSFYDHQCYTVTCSASEGSWQGTHSDNGTCGGSPVPSYSGSGTYTVPPSVLIPGQTVPLAVTTQNAGDGIHTSIKACFYSTSQGLTFDDHGNGSLSPDWCEGIASDDQWSDATPPQGEFTVPADLNTDGVLIIEAGGGLGSFSMSMYYRFLYKWQE